MSVFVKESDISLETLMQSKLMQSNRMINFLEQGGGFDYYYGQIISKNTSNYEYIKSLGINLTFSGNLDEEIINQLNYIELTQYILSCLWIASLWITKNINSGGKKTRKLRTYIK